MLALSRDTRLAKSQDGGILLDLAHGVFFNVNPVGARIIELLHQGCDLSSLTRTIGREFRVSEEIVTRDVDDFLSSLRQQRLLRGDAADSRSDRDK
jgi:Coenzyme PQQ synthesis protein D (PqqD)